MGHGDCSSPASADASAGPGAPAGPASDCLGRHYVGEAHVCGGRAQGTQPARHRVRAEGQRVGTKGPEGPGPRRGRRRRGPRGREDLPDGIPLSHARGLGLPRRPTAHGQRGARTPSVRKQHKRDEKPRQATPRPAAPARGLGRGRPVPMLARRSGSLTLRAPLAGGKARGDPRRSASGRRAEPRRPLSEDSLPRCRRGKRQNVSRLLNSSCPRRGVSRGVYRTCPRGDDAGSRLQGGVCCQLSRGPAGRAGARTVITS